MSMFGSLWVLITGVMARWYFWVFALFFDPFQIVRSITGRDYPWLSWLETEMSVPDGFGGGLLIGLLFAALWATFHEARVRSGSFSAASRPLLTLLWGGPSPPFMSVRTHSSPDGKIINTLALCIGVKSNVSTALDVRVKVDFVNTTSNFLGQEILPRQERDRSATVDMPEGDTRLFQIASAWVEGVQPYSNKNVEVISEEQYVVYSDLAKKQSILVETHNDQDLGKPNVLLNKSIRLYVRVSSVNAPATFCIVSLANDCIPHVEIVSQRLRSYRSWLDRIKAKLSCSNCI